MGNMLNYNYFSHKHKYKDMFRSVQPDAERLQEFIQTYPSLSNIQQEFEVPKKIQKAIDGSDGVNQLPVEPATGKIAKDKDGEDMTLIPKTRCEFEMGEKLSKIKAIRGLTPKKDVKLSFGGSFNAVSTIVV